MKIMRKNCKNLLKYLIIKPIKHVSLFEFEFFR